MKYNRKILFALSLFLVSSVYSQDFVRTIDGKIYWTDLKGERLDNLDEIAVENGRRIIRIPTAQIVLVEYIETGLKILQPDKIQKKDPVAFNNNLSDFFAQGKRVYIPLASSIIAQRWGAKRLRELILENKYWELAGCEEEADFIMEYVFDDKGKDHAYLIMKDRMDENILSTSHVNASKIVPQHAGEESAEKLFKYCLKNIFFNGKIEKRAKKTKKQNDKNHRCLYFIELWQ